MEDISERLLCQKKSTDCDIYYSLKEILLSNMAASQIPISFFFTKSHCEHNLTY